MSLSVENGIKNHLLDDFDMSDEEVKNLNLNNPTTTKIKNLINFHQFTRI